MTETIAAFSRGGNALVRVPRMFVLWHLVIPDYEDEGKHVTKKAVSRANDEKARLD